MKRVRMEVEQEPPLVAVQLRDLVRKMRRCAQTMPTPVEHITTIGDVVMFCADFDMMKRGLELSVTISSQVLQVAGGEGLVVNSLSRASRQTIPKRLWYGRTQTAANFARSPSWSSIDGKRNPCSGHSKWDQGSCSPVFSKAEGRGTGVDAGVDDHQPPHLLAGGEHGGYSDTVCTCSGGEVRQLMRWAAQPWKFEWST